MKRKRVRNLRTTVWVYYVIFISSILVLMWLTFVVSLESNYKNMKTRDIIDIASYILSIGNDENFSIENLDRIAHDNDMCILIQDSRGIVRYTYDMMGNDCLIHGSNRLELFKYRAEAMARTNGIYYAEVKNPRFNTDTLLFVLILGQREDPSGYIYLNTSLEPLNSTSDIIKTQVLWISILMLLLGMGISYFLARLVETPIKKITHSAQKLAQGDYNTEFDGGGYTETVMLASTLNYAANEISKVDGLRRDLIANVSHDLRTPLTMVKAYAEMVRDISGENPAKRNEHINIIIEESDRLALLVNDILDLSKLENGAAEITLSSFDISRKLSEIMERYRLFSEQQGYEFILLTDRPFIVNADMIKLEQVIYNLVNNAVNYTGENKTVYIVQINKKDRVLIEITDTGAGIEPEFIPLIFDRYYRTEKSKREVIGTGLGLSIVKQILKSHNYQFGVRSQTGVGTTFWFEMEGHDGGEPEPR